jgi:hypothetical protein
MKWLEIIKVQTATGFETTIDEVLTVLTKDLLRDTGCSGLVEALIYNHASVQGHFAICLMWDTAYPPTTGSLIGLNLSQTMRPSVW